MGRTNEFRFLNIACFKEWISAISASKCSYKKKYITVDNSDWRYMYIHMCSDKLTIYIRKCQLDDMDRLYSRWHWIQENVYMLIMINHWCIIKNKSNTFMSSHRWSWVYHSHIHWDGNPLSTKINYVMRRSARCMRLLIAKVINQPLGYTNVPWHFYCLTGLFQTISSLIVNQRWQ